MSLGFRAEGTGQGPGETLGFASGGHLRLFRVFSTTYFEIQGPWLKGTKKRGKISEVLVGPQSGLREIGFLTCLRPFGPS